MELRLPTPAQLETVYETDLRHSFPPAELKPLASMQKMWREGWYRPWCLFDGEEITGACFLWLGRPGWALLDYLCVSPNRRNGGTGAALIKLMLEKEQGTAIFAESELPSAAPDPAMAERRLGFYARNSARTAGYDTEVFGVAYKTLYWAPSPIDDETLMDQHRFIYRNSFTPERYARYVRIPLPPGAAPSPKVPWEQ